MQQTEKYKLNLIEPSDPFLPDALNANTQQLEQVVSEQLEAMDQRVTVLELHHFACGTYKGTASSSDPYKEQFIPLPFAPKAVFVFLVGENTQYIMLSVKSDAGERPNLRLEENGFTAKGLGSMNHGGANFNYLAFA